MNIKLLWDRMLCVFFPRRCKYCGEVIEPKEKVCEHCKTSLPAINPPICPFCGHSKSDCSCKNKKNYYSSVVAPFYYEGAIVKAVDRMKFHSHSYLCKMFAEDMENTRVSQYAEVDFDFITFVPFSKRDEKQRDFNHSRLLAEELSVLSGIECVDALTKIYDVPTQHTLGSDARKGNVFGVYEVKTKDVVKDKTILLVDDIKTTGATLDECAKMLKLGGAQEVRALTFAVTKHRKKK